MKNKKNPIEYSIVQKKKQENILSHGDIILIKLL